MARALAAGGSSLSIYLGQSISPDDDVLGLRARPLGRVDRATAVAIAVAVTAALIVAVSIWRTRFALGPFEWVLRRIPRVGFRAEAADGAASGGRAARTRRRRHPRSVSMIVTSWRLMPGSERAWPASAIMWSCEPGQASWSRCAVWGGQIMS